MRTITFYSYKGGVGRSLTLSNIAMRLADLGKTVCIVDFDLEAPGLHLKFGNYIFEKQSSKGVVDFLSDFQSESVVPQTIDDYVIDIDYRGVLNGNIKLIPAGNVYDDDYWKKLSSINWKDLFYSKNSYGVDLLIHFKELIKRDLNPDFILIDSRTGITDISGMAMTLLADSVVVLAANNEENISGATRVIRSLRNEENRLKETLPEIHFVLSRIPYYSNPEKKHIETKIIKKAFATINKNEDLINHIFVIHSDRDLEEEEKFKINQNSTLGNDDIVPIEEDYLNLFEALTKDDLTEEEIVKFNNLKESELLIEEAKGQKDNALKINLLKSAYELNKQSDEALQLLARVYIDLGAYDKAMNYINSAILLAPTNLNHTFYKALVYRELGEMGQAIEICSKILSNNSTHFFSVLLLGEVYYYLGQYDKALEYQIRNIELYPDFEGGYNSVGNTYRVLKNFDKAFEYTYKCLELDPQNILGTGTLAEIYAELGNDEEFLKNLRLAFIFGMKSQQFQKILNQEKVYQKYYDNERFLSLLKNYRIKVIFPELD